MAEHTQIDPPSAKSQILSAFWHSESGATAIEYAMIAAGLSIVIIGSVYQIGSTLNNDFGDVQENYRQAN